MLVGTFLVLAIAELPVPTLVSKPGSPTVTQENLTLKKITVKRPLGLSQVMVGCEICSLKIRVSGVD